MSEREEAGSGPVDVIDLANQVKKSKAGWYPNSDGGGLRYFDGDKWTSNFHPGVTLGDDRATARELLWALCAAFGSAGAAVTITGIPILAYYFPLGFGAASIAMGIAAFTRSGQTPWYGPVGLVFGVVAVVSGMDAYNQFSDTANSLSNF